MDLFQQTLKDKIRKTHLAMLRKDGMNLERIDEVYRDKGICIAAIRKSPLALQFVPFQIMNKGMCMEAVSRDANALQYVPVCLYSSDIFEAVAESDSDCFLQVILNDPASFKMIPHGRKTKNNCFIACLMKGDNLRCVPEYLKDMGIYKAAVTSDGSMLSCVPKKDKDEEMCLRAVKQNKLVLEHVPKELRTEEMYALAFGGK